MTELRVVLGMSEARQWARVPFPLPAAITLRSAGNMRLDSPERRKLYDSLGISPQRVCVLRQVHSRTVVPVADGGAQDRGAPTTATGERLVAEADGMVTRDAEAVLAVTVADCMPIWLFDAVTGARGLLHSGWRGTGIVAEAIRVMGVEFGTRARDLVVVLGPCISVEAYRVDGERARAFAAEWGEETVQRRDGGAFLDLRRANLEICRRSGVDLASVIDHCTVRDARLGSYRRQGPEDYTLMLALLGGPATRFGEKTTNE